MVVPLICWLALISDGYDLFSYGATLPGLIDADPWHITAAQGGLVGQHEPDRHAAPDHWSPAPSPTSSAAAACSSSRSRCSRWR